MTIVSTGRPRPLWIVASLHVPHDGCSTNSWLVAGREEIDCGGVGARMLIIACIHVCLWNIQLRAESAFCHPLQFLSAFPFYVLLGFPF